METIKLNDLLQLTREEIDKTKIRFMVPSSGIDFDPNTDAEDPSKQDKINLTDLVYNREKSMSFTDGVIAIGFIRIRDDYWLMTGIVKVIKAFRCLVWPFAVWCGWVCQVVTVLRSSLPQVR